jgi:hypothetical protein
MYVRTLRIPSSVTLGRARRLLTLLKRVYGCVRVRGHQVDIEGGAAIQTGYGCGTDELRDSNFNVADLSVAQRNISTIRRGRHRRSSS